MPFLRPSPRPIFRFLQTRTYASAATPAINVTIVPAPHCGSIRILSLNRPAARNAISRQLLAELSHQINSIHDEGDNGSTRALILASDVDSSFCAGADLKERATFTAEEYVYPFQRPSCLQRQRRLIQPQHSELPDHTTRYICVDITTPYPHNLRARSPSFRWRPRISPYNTHAHLRQHH
jgi:hypothetical protein